MDTPDESLLYELEQKWFQGDSSLKEILELAYKEGYKQSRMQRLRCPNCENTPNTVRCGQCDDELEVNKD